MTTKTKRDRSEATAEGGVAARPWLSRLAAPAVLSLLGIVVYANSFQVPFVFDGGLVLHNFERNEIWPWQVSFGKNRPIGFLSFTLNYLVGGEHAWGYHAVSLAIHVAAAWLLYALVRLTLSRPPLAERFGSAAGGLALATAAIWLVHPLETESVTYVYQRLEALMGLFYLLTLYAFVRGQQSARPALWYAGSVVACGLGMGTKEVMVSAPLIVLWYDRAFLASSWREIFRTRWMYYAALASTWGILAYLVVSALESYPGAGVLTVQGVTPLQYALSQAGVIVHYLKLCFWPEDLCIDYAWPVADTARAIVPPLLAIVALLAGTVWCVFRRPALGFLGGCFFLILAPTSSIAPIVDLAFEHRMYLPLAAVTVLVVVLAYEAWRKASPQWFWRLGWLRKLLATAVVLAVVAALGAATLARNEDYRSEVALWQATVRTTPENSRAHSNLAWHAFRQGQYPQAIEEADRAIKLNPGYAQAYHNRGVAYQHVGNLQQGVADLSKAIELNPQFASPYNNRGLIYERLGDFGRALADISQAIKVKPDLIEAYYNRARVYARVSRPDLAAADMTTVLARAADQGRAYRRRAEFYLAMSRYDDAVADDTRALELKGDDSKTYVSRALALKHLHKYPQTKADLDAALRLDPENSVALNERAWLLATCPDAGVRSGEQAVADASRACELTDWKRPQCLDTLAAAHAERGDFQSAVKWEGKAIELAHNTPLAHNAQPRLKQYRSGKPYRDTQ